MTNHEETFDYTRAALGLKDQAPRAAEQCRINQEGRRAQNYEHRERAVRVRFLHNWSISRLLILANIVFWLVFAALFVAGTYPYMPHRLVFEEATPSYIFFGRALREIDSGTGVSLPPPLIKLTYAIQKPSVLAAKPFYWPFDSRGITVDRQYWRISVGGYYLLLVCVLSFVQWFLVGWVVQKLRHKWFSHSAAAPNQTESASTTP